MTAKPKPASLVNSLTVTSSTEGVYKPHLDLTKVHFSEDNPRKFLDPKLLAELADSIKTHGVVQPIVVRDHPKKKDEYELVAGDRRCRASVIAERKTIPALIRIYTDQQAAEVRQIENLQRSDVHPMDEAHGFQNLIAKFGYTVDTIATKISKPAWYVAKRMKLVDLVKVLQEKFWKGELSVVYAETLCRLPADIQADCAKSFPHGWIWNSISQLRRHIEDETYHDVTKAPWGMKDTGLAGKVTCEACPERSGNAPQLFPELNKTPNICTNRSCYQLKRDAFVKAMLDSHPNMVSISMSYGTAPKGMLGPDAYQVVKPKACKFAETAIVAQGDSRENGMGSVVTICHAKACPKHAASHSTSRSGGDGKEAARQRQFRLAQTGRTAAFQALFAAPADKITFAMEEHRELALYLFDRSNNRDKVASAIGWERKKGTMGSRGYTPTAQAFIKKASLPELQRLIMMLVLSPMIVANSYGPNESLKPVFEFGKRWGINAESAHDKAIGELQAKFAKRAKKWKKK